ncbi:MAG: hypothetical protein IIX03_04150 [Paludibacteraceae bacterium]|nr:hypothetical protein [Paludibacteraceae bacterium]
MIIFNTHFFVNILYTFGVCIIPFFSTKPDGTGIGLSLSRQIMRLHNGTIRLLHSDDRQTIFSLLFK